MNNNIYAQLKTAVRKYGQRLQRATYYLVGVADLSTGRSAIIAPLIVYSSPKKAAVDFNVNSELLRRFRLENNLQFFVRPVAAEELMQLL